MDKSKSEIYRDKSKYYQKVGYICFKIVLW